MRAKLILGIIIIVIIIGAAWAIASRSGSNDSLSGNGNSAANTSSASNSAQPTATNKVTIANMAFGPADITVKKGTSVTWTNQDSIAHTVTENDGKNGPSAPPLNQGQGYSFTFSETGTFHYHCSIHPEMVGTVTVTD